MVWTLSYKNMITHKLVLENIGQTQLIQEIMYNTVNHEESGNLKDLVPTHNIFAISKCVFVYVLYIFLRIVNKIMAKTF